MEYKVSLYIKPLLFISSIIGGILGLITLIPFPLFKFFVISCLYWLIGAACIIYMKKNNLITEPNINDGAIIGAISGLVGVVSASVVYFPISAFLGFLSHFDNFSFLRVFAFEFPFSLIILTVIFLGFLNAIGSAFSGLTAVYVYEFLDKSSSISEFKIEDENSENYYIDDNDDINRP